VKKHLKEIVGREKERGREKQRVEEAIKKEK